MTRIDKRSAPQAPVKTEVTAPKAAPAEAKAVAPKRQPPPATGFTAQPQPSLGALGNAPARPVQAVPFTPATGMPYECTIHTLQMQGDDGKTYNVVLDLIRNDKNPKWGVNEDHTALRAVVSDAATGQVVSSKFIDSTAKGFQDQVGKMDIMDGNGHIDFAAKDGSMSFDLDAIIRPSTLVQQGADGIKQAFEDGIKNLPPDQQQKLRDSFAMQLLVTDYPKTEHTGSMTVKVPGSDKPLTLTAKNQPSTISHHYGNSLTDYVFLSSVPKPGQPSFIAVVTKEGIDLDPNKKGAELEVPFGYIIRTDEKGKSTFALLNPNVDKGKAGQFSMGDDFLGTHLDVQMTQEAGQVAVNGGQLMTKTGFGKVTIDDSELLKKLGLQKGESFPDVVVDVTGSFIGDSGRDR